MTDRIQTDVGYGLLGEARYRPDEAVWRAQRTLDAPAASTALIPDRYTLGQEHASNSPGTLTEPGRSAAVEEIIRDEPTLQPARKLIADLLAETSRDEDLDQVGGFELMTVVFISERERRHKRINREDATDPLFRKQPMLVASKGRNILDFVIPKKSKIAFEHGEEARSDAYELSGAEGAQYVSDDGPILQVVRPEPLGGVDVPSVVAARTPSAILVFRPTPGKSQPFADSHRKSKAWGAVPPQPNLIKRIELGPINGACDGHIAFNPWDSGQLAYVAADGRWMAWSLRSQHPTLICQSTLSSDTTDYVPPDDRCDYRVTWVLDAYHLLISSTNIVQIFDLVGRLVFTWTIDAQAFGSHIKQVKRSTWDAATIVLTTTSHVLLLTVESGKALTIGCILAWRHHLSPSEILYGVHFLSSYDGQYLPVFLQGLIRIVQSLQLLTLHTAGSQCILVSGNRTSLLLRLSLLSGAARRIELCDATRTRWPFDHIRGLAVLPGRTSGNHLPRPDHAGAEDKGIVIAQVFALRQDLEIEHALFYATKLPSDRSYEFSQHPRFKFISGSRPVKSAQYVHESDDDDFVVHDFGTWAEASDDLKPYANLQHSPAISRSEVESTFSIPHDRTYRCIAFSENSSTIELVDALATITNTSFSFDTEHDSLGTLDERLPQLLSIANIEETSARVGEILHRFNPRNATETDPLGLASLSSSVTPSLASVGIESPSLSAIYGRLMSCWLRPLTHRAPPRTRMSLENLIRQIAAAICLSSIGVTTVPSGRGVVDEDGDRKGSLKRRDTNSSEALSQLPTPTPISSTEDRTSLPRLHQYTNIEAPPGQLTSSLTRILDYWDPAVHPSDYDYTKKSAHLEDLDAGVMSQEEKQREQRRAESKRRREESSQRKRAKMGVSGSGAQSQSQASRPAGFSPPSASTQPAGMSQPLAGRLGDGSDQASQPILSSQGYATASQIQPGKFGGKLPVRGRRKAGF